MAEYLGKDFVNTTEVVDGNSYNTCSFNACTIIYRGGDIPTFSGCRLDRCVWQFEGPAERTLAFLKGIYSGMGPGARAMIEDLFQKIRTPFPGKKQ